MSNYAKMFGERNTGTNWLEAIVRYNTYLEILPGSVPSDWREPYEEELAARSPQDAEVTKQWIIERLIEENFEETFGWKHQNVDWERLRQANPEKFSKTLFFCIVRDPYKWLTSLHRRPYSAVFVDKALPAREGWEGFPLFLRTPWLCLDRDNIKHVLLESPADLWWRKVISLPSMRPNVVFVRYGLILLGSSPGCRTSVSSWVVNESSSRTRREIFTGACRSWSRGVRTRSYLQHYTEADFEYLRPFLAPAQWKNFDYEVM